MELEHLVTLLWTLSQQWLSMSVNMDSANSEACSCLMTAETQGCQESFQSQVYWVCVHQTLGLNQVDPQPSEQQVVRGKMNIQI